MLWNHISSWHLFSGNFWFFFWFYFWPTSCLIAYCLISKCLTFIFFVSVCDKLPFLTHSHYRKKSWCNLNLFHIEVYLWPSMYLSCRMVPMHWEECPLDFWWIYVPMTAEPISSIPSLKPRVLGDFSLIYLSRGHKVMLKSPATCVLLKSSF